MGEIWNICLKHSLDNEICTKCKIHRHAGRAAKLSDLSTLLQQVLKEAEEDLRAAQQVVSDGQKKLEEVEESIPPLEVTYQECLAKQKKLDDEYELTEAHLVRAKKVGRKTEAYI